LNTRDFAAVLHLEEPFQCYRVICQFYLVVFGNVSKFLKWFCYSISAEYGIGYSSKYSSILNHNCL